jgi:hypothetical protein
LQGQYTVKIKVRVTPEEATKAQRGGTSMKRSTVSLTLALDGVIGQLDAPITYPRKRSILSTETGCPDFGVFVFIYWISRKIPGIALITP